jgi:hypothetical protein
LFAKRKIISGSSKKLLTKAFFGVNIIFNRITKGDDEDGKGDEVLQRAGGAEIPADGCLSPITSELRI